MSQVIDAGGQAGLKRIDRRTFVQGTCWRRCRTRWW